VTRVQLLTTCIHGAHLRALLSSFISPNGSKTHTHIAFLFSVCLRFMANKDVNITYIIRQQCKQCDRLLALLHIIVCLSIRLSVSKCFVAKTFKKPTKPSDRNANTTNFSQNLFFRAAAAMQDSFIHSFFICSNNSRPTTCNFTVHNEQDNKAKQSTNCCPIQ